MGHTGLVDKLLLGHTVRLEALPTAMKKPRRRRKGHKPALCAYPGVGRFPRSEDCQERWPVSRSTTTGWSTCRLRVPVP